MFKGINGVLRCNFSTGSQHTDECIGGKICYCVCHHASFVLTIGLAFLLTGRCALYSDLTHYMRCYQNKEPTQHHSPVSYTLDKPQYVANVFHLIQNAAVGIKCYQD